MASLFIIRGLPGSGKTTLAHEIASRVYSADDYFTNRYTGEYHFVAEHLHIAHSNCLQNVRLAMRDRCNKIAVANTFSMRWEMQLYYDAAKEFGYTVYELTCNGKFKNTHNVPEETISKMMARWEN